MKTGCVRLHLKKRSHAQFFVFFFGCFCRKFCHTDVDSREQQAILLKKGKISGQNCAFLFFRRKNWNDFVTPFSTLANIKGSLSTKSTTPDRLRCRTRTEVKISRFFGFNIARKSFSKGPASSPDLHPKEAHSRIFVTRGSISRNKCWPKRNSILGRPACTKTTILSRIP